MRRAEIPEEIRRFVLTSVPSVPYLEAVLLLRADPGAGWDVPRLAARLYVAERQAAEVLSTLAAAGIARSEEQGETALFYFAPATAELRERLDALAQAYSANLVGVTDLTRATGSSSSSPPRSGSKRSIAWPWGYGRAPARPIRCSTGSGWSPTA